MPKALKSNAGSRKTLSAERVVPSSKRAKLKGNRVWPSANINELVPVSDDDAPEDLAFRMNDRYFGF